MFCTNCGKEFPDTEKLCPYCGTEKMDIQSLENESRKNMPGENRQIGTVKPKTWKDKLMDFVGTVCGVFLLIGLCIGAKNWIQSHNAEKNLYTTMYDSAVDEVKELLSEASNVKTEDYDKDNVVFQEYDYYDFGHGTLRYARYAVSVPTKWDTVYGQMDERLTLNVYYYTSRQNISDGVDTSVPDHIHTEDISQEFDDWIEDLGNLGNFDYWD